MFGKKKKQPAYAYDPVKQKAVLRCSICTGETVAGFKDIETGRFEEVMLIRGPKDLEELQKIYHVEEWIREY